MTEEKPKNWMRYTSLEPVKRLRYDGRELLGKTLTSTVKRDGENVSIWLDEYDTPHIASHNGEEAEPDIQNRMKATPEYLKAVELIKDEKNQWHNDCILYGELMKTISPTRIEPKRKNIHWIMFDIWSKPERRYMDYTLVYQKGYHFKIPVVELVDTFIPLSLEELYAKVKEQKKWCRRHRKEGVVIKDYVNQVFTKEKVDLPKRPKLEKPQKGDVDYPPMTQECIERAVQHAIDQVGVDNWLDRSKSMPILARHLNTEASEHYFSVPKNFYSIYLDSLVDDRYKHL
jgi:hypothetical protein